MAHAPDRNGGVTTGIPARNFFDVDELLSNARLAFLYTDMLINSPTTITAAKERTGLKKSTAYKYRNELAEMGLARELDRHEDGAALWEVDAIGGDWIGDDHITVGPTVIIAVYGASTTDEDIDLFIDRHGRRPASWSAASAAPQGHRSPRVGTNRARSDRFTCSSRSANRPASRSAGTWTPAIWESTVTTDGSNQDPSVRWGRSTSRAGRPPRWRRAGAVSEPSGVDGGG